MDAERWRRIEQLYHAALELHTEQREAFLAEATRGDDALRVEVQELLALPCSTAYIFSSLQFKRQRFDQDRRGTFVPGSKLGPYRIEAILGTGGMGEVYKAHDVRLHRVVAIKVLRPPFSRDAEFRLRFDREARAVSCLNHPHICISHDVGHQGDIEYLVIEYLEGETLAQRLKRGRLPLKEALHIGIDVADALAEAHRHRVIHRDLKPDNLMLTKSGVKVLDFGVAKILGSPADKLPDTRSEITQEGAFIGTLQYMAPEQLEGRIADSRSDIFAFGSVLYEAISGRRAFEAETNASLIAAIMTEEPRLLTTVDPRVPAALSHAVAKCLAKDPGRRWQTAQDLRDQLEWIAEEKSSLVATPKSSHTVRLGFAATLLLGLSLVFLAFQYTRNSKLQPGVVRVSISPPEKTSFTDPVAISPDGARLALIAARLGDQPSLWVRRLDSLTALALPGTEGADDPFWSPDGESIAFFAGAKLKRADISGGPIRTVCDAPLASGGSWSKDGAILLSLQNRLYRVPAEGGKPLPVALDDHLDLEHADAWPHFLPDGRHFVYTTIGVLRKRPGEGATVNSWEPRNDAVYIGSVDSKETKRLLETHWMTSYAPAPDGSEGYLFFLANGDLLAQHFDSKSLQLRGQPVPLAERVSDVGHAAYFTVSNNGILAYRTAAIDRTELTWYDRSGKKSGTLGLPMQDLHPKISPDGKRVAVSRGDVESSNARALVSNSSAHSDIWVLDLERGGASRITFDGSADWPLWSPDGTRVAYSSNREGNWNIYVKAANGEGKEELLVKSDEDKHPNDFSRDGRFLVYTSVNAKTSIDLWILPLLGDRRPFPFLRTRFIECLARFSPDGQWMAYQSREPFERTVYVRPFEPSRAVEGSASESRWPISTDGGTCAAWRHDGRELYYLHPDDRIMAVELKSGISGGLRTFEAAAPKLLFRVRAYGNCPFTASADGQRFLVNAKVGEEAPPSVAVILNWTALLPRSRT